MPHSGRLAPLVLLAAACFHDHPPALNATSTGGSSRGDSTGDSTGAALDPTAGTGTSTTTGDDATSAGATACAPTLWYQDLDLDGHGDPNTTQLACTQPAGLVAVGDDCDDADPARAPGKDEVCDQKDNDCDPFVDEYSPLNTTCMGCALFARAASSYAFCLPPGAYAAARSECQARGGDLVVIDDVDENSALAVQGATVVGGTGSWYIGFNDILVEGSFVWLDGGAAAYVGWDVGEPNDLEGEDCAVLRDDGTWNDQNCALATPFLCELATGP